MKLTTLAITTALLFLWLFSITWDVSEIIAQTFLNSDPGSIPACCGTAFPSTPLSPYSCMKCDGQSVRLNINCETNYSWFCSAVFKGIVHADGCKRCRLRASSMLHEASFKLHSYWINLQDTFKLLTICVHLTRNNPISKIL